MQDHCIETTWAEVHRKDGLDQDYLSHYRNEEELPEWLGENAELQLTKGAQDTGGGRIGIQIRGANPQFNNKDKQPVLRINGVWGRVRLGVDSSGNRSYAISFTEVEYQAVFNHDGEAMEDEDPRPLTKRLALIAGRKGKLPRERYVVWAKEAQEYSQKQDFLSLGISQLNLLKRSRASAQEAIDSRWASETVKARNAAKVRERDQQIPALEADIATASIRYAELSDRLEDWESGTDPDADNPLVFERIEKQKARQKAIAKVEEIQDILDYIGESHEQYPIGVQMLEKAQDKLAAIDARLAEINAALNG